MARAIYVLIDGELITKAIDGVLTEEYSKLSAPNKRNPFTGFGSDYLPGGVNGILNHADGKHYDSKSQYERAVREKGCRVVGNDWNNVKQAPQREIRGDFNVRPALKQAVEKVFR